jgi:eukaryotic-like serine/threonine-protein kinase
MEIGHVLDGRFELEASLGDDSVAQVWRARDLQLDRHVVVRQLHKHLLEDQAVFERFRLEAEAAARLSHGHVANLFDVAISDALAYTVGEYVDGPSLARLIEDGPLDATVVAAIGNQAALGLAAAHEAGIVHRDVRPGNLLIGRDGRVRVVDFGSARIPDVSGVHADAATTRSEVYLAPEQLEDGVIGTDRSDVYALGRTLTRALDGSAVAGPPDAEGLVGRVLGAIPGLPFSSSREERLRTLLGEATDPDPDRRPAAAALAEALQGLDDRRADEVLRQLVDRLPTTDYGRRPSER